MVAAGAVGAGLAAHAAITALSRARYKGDDAQ
jgi:hydrogenase small subunit